MMLREWARGWAFLHYPKWGKWQASRMLIVLRWRQVRIRSMYKLDSAGLWGV